MHPGARAPYYENLKKKYYLKVLENFKKYTHVYIMVTLTCAGFGIKMNIVT
jgi:hypothetical protein